MDLKNWEKISEDDHSVEMRHPKGHTMRIAVKALPRVMQEQIKRLGFAKGGKVSDDVLDSGEDGESTQGKAVRHANKLKNRGESGKEEMHHAKEEAKGRAKMEKMVPKPKFAEGTPDGPVEQEEPEKMAMAQPPATVINIGTPTANSAPAPQPSLNPNPEMTAQEPAPMAKPSAAVNLARKPMPVPEAKVPEAVSNLNPNGTMNPAAVMHNTQSAVEGQKNINAAKSEADVQREQALIQGVGEQEQAKQERLAGYAKHVEDATKYINENLPALNPNHYQESMTSGQKVASAIGLALGGFSVPFGGHNFAFDYLNKQIDRDLQAQKDRIGEQKTILGAYQQLYGEGLAADNATKANLMDIYAAQAREQAAKLGTPQAAQGALQIGAAMAAEKSKALQEGAVELGNLPGTRSIAPPGKSSSPKAGGSGPGDGGPKASGGEAKKEGVLTHSLLAPNAEARFRALQYQPKAKEQIAEITRQFTQAQQADKALKNINNTYMSLWKDANAGGAGGRFRRTVDPENLPGSGTVGDIVKGVGKGLQQLSNTDTNRRYEAQQTELKGYLSAALKGTNVGDHTIDDIVRKNSPEYGDSERSMAMKLKTIRDFISNHTETSLLKTWGLTKE